MKSFDFFKCYSGNRLYFGVTLPMLKCVGKSKIDCKRKRKIIKLRQCQIASMELEHKIILFKPIVFYIKESCGKGIQGVCLSLFSQWKKYTFPPCYIISNLCACLDPLRLEFQVTVLARQSNQTPPKGRKLQSCKLVFFKGISKIISFVLI